MRSLAPDVTEGPRMDILRCVERNPGVHLRSIERRTELPLGQVLYHLDRLERMGLLVSARDRGFRRYYRVGDIDRHEKPVLAALRHRVPRRLVVALLREPALSHGELRERLGVAGSTLSFHLQRLMGSGVLAREKDGPSFRYRVAEPDLARGALSEWRESFQDPLVDAFVEEDAARAARAPPGPPAPSAEADGEATRLEVQAPARPTLGS